MVARCNPGQPREPVFPRAMTRRAAVQRAVTILACAICLHCTIESGIAAERGFDLRIAKRHLEGKVSTIRVARGDHVELRWTTDEAVTIHLHGYDVAATLTPMSPSRMVFEAGIAGRFPVSVHNFAADKANNKHSGKHRELTLLYLEVQP